MERSRLSYWGPALIVIGVIAGVAASALLQHVALYVAIVVAATVALAGVVLVGYERQR